MQLLLSNTKYTNVFVKSTEDEATLYFSLMGNYLKQMKVASIESITLSPNF